MATAPSSDTRQADGSSDRRWVVLMPDGSATNLGRARDPGNDEIAAVAATMESQGVGGWLAVQSHSFYRGSFPTFLAVQTFGEPIGNFEQAVDALRARTEA